MKWKSAAFANQPAALRGLCLCRESQAIRLPPATSPCTKPCSWHCSTTTTSASPNTRSRRKQHAKEVAKSAYFPTIRNDSNFVHLTDTQLIQIQAGSLGTVAGNPVPPATATINQGGRDLTTSGTQLTQPLTTLLKIRPTTTWRKPS